MPEHARLLGRIGAADRWGKPELAAELRAEYARLRAADRVREIAAGMSERGRRDLAVELLTAEDRDRWFE